MAAMNVCTEVVDRDLCSGCGVCAAVCPQKTLTIEWNAYGEYIAVDRHQRCSAKCSLCLQVCPFAPDAENEDSLGEKLFASFPGIQHRTETGYYLQGSVGYSNVHNQRINGSSGGLATWMLETLLSNNLVDNVLCVAPNSERDTLFHFAVCSTPEQVRACAKSSYYPVELSAVLRQVAAEEGRYALIGQPCAIKAVRLAMQKMPLLRRRITHVLGIVCGQQKGKFFSEYVTTLQGADPQNLVALHFREKDPNRPATDYGLRYECADDQGRQAGGTVYWSEGMATAWLRRYFTLNACNYCDDLFAELADATFMDAWLPKYSGDWRGTSIVLTRDPSLQSLIDKGLAEGELVMEPLAVEQVIQSQAGGLANKRTVLAKRLSWGVEHQQWPPLKRVQPVPCSYAEGLALTIEMANIAASRRIFLELKSRGCLTVQTFSRKMGSVAMLQKLAAKVVHKIRRIKHKIMG